MSSTELDLETIKNSIRDTLRDNIMPSCTFALEEYLMSDGVDNKEISQSFIPYSTMLGTLRNYTSSISLVLKKTGAPSAGISLYLESDSNGEPSGTSLGSASIAPASVGTVATTISTPMTISNTLGTKTQYWLRVVPNSTASSTDLYSIYRDTVDTHYWRGSSSTRDVGGSWGETTQDVYFDVKTPNWIWGNYPHLQLSLWSYPRVAVDFIGRPKSEQKWLDHRLSVYHITAAITVYSRYADETDDIISNIDNAIFRKRVDISGVKLAQPGEITPLAMYREKLYTKSIRFNIQKRIVATP